MAGGTVDEAVTNIDEAEYRRRFGPLAPTLIPDDTVEFVDLDAAAICTSTGCYKVGSIAEMRVARQAAAEEKVRLHEQSRIEHRAKMEERIRQALAGELDNPVTMLADWIEALEHGKYVDVETT